MPLNYKINVLQALKDAGYTTTRIRKEKIIGEATLTQIRNKEPISWANIEKLCALLDIQPGDLIEYKRS